MFLDSAIQAVHKAAVDDDANSKSKYEQGDYHSRLEMAGRDVQDLMTDLTKIEGKIRVLGKALEISDEIDGVFGNDFVNEKGPSFSLPPKVDQDADKISIADEEDIGTDPADLPQW